MPARRGAAQDPGAVLIGESVKVISGPLSDFSGEIAEINEDAAKLKVLVRSSAGKPPLKSATTR